MKRLVIALAFGVLAATAQGQATDCPAGVNGAITPAAQGQNAARDVCLRAKDVFSLIAPQLGGAITGGNAVLGQGGTLGGIGKFTVEARVTSILNGDVPKVTSWPGLATTNPPQSQELETLPLPVPMPVIDGAIGVFKGLPLGLTNVGGIDILGSVTYIPSLDQDEIKVTPEANTKFGYGARIGLLQESLVVPGISVTWMERDLPTTTITGAATFTGTSMSFTMSDAAIKTNSWRIVASKSFLLFGIAAGYGQDRYNESATFSGTATVLTQNTTFAPFTVESKMTRSNVFANAYMNILLLKIVGEIGQISGGDASPTPFNTFSGGTPADSRTYGGLSLRFTW